MAQRATSLGPKPSLFFIFLFFFSLLSFLCFPFLVFNWKPLFSSPQKTVLLFIFLCFPLFLFSLFWASPFFTFSFSLSLSLSLLFVSFFLASCFSCQFLVLAFCYWFVCVLFQDVLLFLFFCLLSCFVLNHNLRFAFILHLLLLLFLFWLISYFLFLLWQPLKNISEKWNFENRKNETCRKTDILTRTVSTGVFTNGVSFSLMCFFKILHFCWKHRIWGFSKKEKTKIKTIQILNVKNWSKHTLKTGPSMLRNMIGRILTH